MSVARRRMFRFALLPALVLIAASALAEKPIALHPDNPHYFLFRGKPAVLITSAEHYGVVLNLDFDYVPYLSELQSKGLNLTRTFSGTYREIPGTFKITSNTLAPLSGARYICPWARTDTPGAADGGAKWDLARYDEAYFKRLKDFIGEAGKRGVVVELVLFCTYYEDPLWNVCPMNARNNVNGVGNVGLKQPLTLGNDGLLAYQEALVRKIVGELKDFDNLYYEICNEPYFNGVTLEWQKRISDVIADAEKDFAARHLIAQNIANKGAKVGNPDPNVSIFNFHYANPPATVGDNYGLNKAIAFDESGFRGNDDAPYRTEAWEFILAGGAVYDNLDYSFTPMTEDGSARVTKPTPGGGGARLREQLKTLRDFVQGFDFVRMKPDASIVKGRPEGAKAYALVEPGKQYAIYVLGGKAGDLRLDLPAGRYRVERLNPITGKVEKTGELDHKAGEATLALPAYEGEIALRIVRAEK